MNADTMSETARVRDAESCREWLARLDSADVGRLPSVDRLMRNLLLSSQDGDALLEIAEQARRVHLAELGGVLDRIDTEQFPIAEADRMRLLPAIESLRLGREVYKRIDAVFAQSGEPRPARAHALGTPPSGARLAVARALDYQVRLLVALLRNRAVVPAADWDELCLLAGRIRADGFIDVPLPDDSPLLRKASTPRALFAYPLLLQLAEPGTRSEGAYLLGARLARRWCGRIGFRFDGDAAAGDVRHGPTVALTDRHSVRLVTHRLRRRLEERRRELEALGARAAARLPKGMSIASALRLVEDLTRLWCEPRVVPYTPDVHLGELKVRFGLPRRDDAAPSAPRRPIAMNTQASRSYIYGHFEQNTSVRRVTNDFNRVDPLRDWAERAIAARWVSIDRQQAIYELSGRASGLIHGALALLVLPAPEADSGAGGRPVGRPAPPRRVFGRVVSLSHRFVDESKAPAVPRVGIAMWAGEPALVGLRVGDAKAFEDAFLLTPDPRTGEPESVVMASGRFAGPGPAMLRDGAREVRVRLDALLDRGSGYERVRIVRDAA